MVYGAYMYICTHSRIKHELYSTIQCANINNLNNISATHRKWGTYLWIENIYIYIIYPITCWPHCSYFSREAWRPNSELPLPGLQHLWHCLSASAKPSTGEGRFLGQWEPQNCFDPWAKHAQHPSVSKKHGHGSTGMMFHIFFGVNIHWKQFRTLFWCDNQVLNHTHHGEKTEDIALLFAGEPKNGGIGESWGLPPNHPLPIVAWGSPTLRNPLLIEPLTFIGLSKFRKIDQHGQVGTQSQHVTGRSMGPTTIPDFGWWFIQGSIS